MDQLQWNAPIQPSVLLLLTLYHRTSPLEVRFVFPSVACLHQTVAGFGNSRQRLFDQADEWTEQ